MEKEKQLNILLERYNALRSKYEDEKKEFNILSEQLNCKNIEINELTKNKETTLLMKEVVLKSTEQARSRGKDLLQTVATKAVKMTMDDNLEINIETATKSGVPHSEIVLYVGDEENKKGIDPCEEDGGGLADVVALSVFIALRMLSGKNNSAPYFLDEPFKYVSAGNAENTANFMREIADYSNTQTFVVTHELSYLPSLADKTYKFTLKDGETHVEELNAAAK